jgi:hypothetical protein
MQLAHMPYVRLHHHRSGPRSKAFFNNLPCAAWEKLNCLYCQSLEDLDRYLFECLNDVTKAISKSLTRKKPCLDCTTLWYHVGLLFAVGGPAMRGEHAKT